MRILNLRQSSRLVASCLALLLVVSFGCSGLKKNRTDDFVKPLAEISAEQKVRHQPLPEERTLCIETAKTVAEKGHTDEAIQLYQRAEELDSSQSFLDEQLAPLYAQAGDFDAAIERYQRLVSASPKDIELCNNFAWTLMDAKRYGEAITEAGRGLSLNDNKRLRTTLAMTYYRQGDRTSAWEQFAKAQDLTAAHHNLAVLDIDAGKLDSAREHLHQASMLRAENPDDVNLRIETLLAALNDRGVAHPEVQ